MLMWWWPRLPSALLPVIFVHLFGDVAVGAVGAVDEFELLFGLFAFAHFFQRAPQVIDQLFLFIVEDELLLDGPLERARGQLVHAPARVALAEIIHRFDLAVRIGLGPLKLLDRFADLSRLKIKLAQLETDLQIGWEPPDTLLAFGELKGL